jgi:hypothetical protein
MDETKNFSPPAGPADRPFGDVKTHLQAKIILKIPKENV